MKTKKFTFDVELIIDHKIHIMGNQIVDLSTHRRFNGLTTSQLSHLIRSNEDVPTESDIKITFFIKGVNY